MKTILDFLKKLFSGQLAIVTCSLLDSIKQIFKYLEGNRLDKKEKQAKKEHLKFEDKIDDIVDKGSIKDLLNL